MSRERLPVVFVSDMGPMPAFDDDAYARALGSLGASLPRPKAVVVMSGHWDAAGTLAATSARRPELICDYAGFPSEWYSVPWKPLGSPETAAEAARLLAQAGFPAREDPRRGLDHGAWVPLTRLFPKADVPVVQLTVPAGEAPRRIRDAGRALAPLRERGVLLVASGTLVHNLRMMRFGEKHAAEDGWAAAFDAWLEERLRAGDLDSVYEYRRLAPSAALAAPTPEHFDPLFFALGAADGDAPRPGFRAMVYGCGLERIFSFGF
jgi:4,5-DOPA dioxygenase extradiol